MTVSNFQANDFLQAPQVVDERYMLLPVERGFDWEGCFENIFNGDWYLVVFRSKHRADADMGLLTWLDDGATEAAKASDGFLYYFTGTALPTGECLSFCLWTDRDSAVKGASHIAHNTARQLGSISYEYYCLERYNIRKEQGKLSFTALPFGHSSSHK